MGGPLLFAAQIALAAPAPGERPDQARAAIVEAIRQRMGPGAEVQVDALTIRPGGTAAVAAARPDPGARLGRPMRFSLATPARDGNRLRWSAAAEAVVQVVVDHLHARAVIERGRTIEAGDVELVRHAVESGPLRAWPAAEAVGRSRAIRDLAPGVCIPPSSLAGMPLVQAGQDVRVIARLGPVTATARLVAAESGDPGAVIRIVNPQSRRALRARVVAAGTVEVLP
jgi:flagella basal body P-ring formation protein FlgA